MESRVSDNYENMSSLKMNDRYGVSHTVDTESMFIKRTWDTQNSNKKKELPPLQNTVDIFRNVTKAKAKKRSKLKNNTNITNHEDLNKAYENRESVNIDLKASKINEGYHDDNKEYLDENVELNNDKLSNDKVTFSTRNENNNIKSSNESNHSTNIDYKKMALDLASENLSKESSTNVRRKRFLPDFLLVFDCLDNGVLHLTLREQFESAICKEGIEIVYSIIGDRTFVELYAKFERLCQEAETVALEMPLEGFLLDPNVSMWSTFSKSMKTDDQVDMVSGPFSCDSREMFQGIENERTFFRSSYRSMLVRHILENLTMSFPEQNGVSQKKKGLSSMLVSGAYKDAFILNERSHYDKTYPLTRSIHSTFSFTTAIADSRMQLHNTWLKCIKFQPLWKIRNYYGEKIALYFAWLGILITSLWIPTLLGIMIFVYGFAVSSNRNKSGLSVSTITAQTTAAFDNALTPYFALIICLWGTVFCEFWKRRNAELAYRWDVDLFEEQETKRPQFFGTKEKKEPVTGEVVPYYPKWRKAIKAMGSAGVIVFMVLLVVTSVISVVVFKVVSRVDWFTTLPNGEFASSLTSSILNSISILILGRLYRVIAYKLTDWENHETKTNYEDGLIIKLFGFQFVNSYASLFYIAFFRKRSTTGVFDLGSEYSDSCGPTDDCMSMLSLQVAVLMIAKPMPKFFTDIVIPVLLKYMKKCCCCFRSSNVINTSSVEMSKEDPKHAEYRNYIEEEYKKPPLVDFTLSEYTEKVLQYGYLMMFAAAFPLAPLIALITNAIDLRVDARRMLWFNRRPFPERAEDIGMWFTILNLLNYAGMLTNALIIGLTSKYGSNYKSAELVYKLPTNMTVHNSVTNTTLTSLRVQYTSNNNLWIIIIFQNVVLIVKFILAYTISDIPQSVAKAKSQEKVQLGKLLTNNGRKLGPGKTIKIDHSQGTADATLPSSPMKNRRNMNSVQ